MQFGVVSWLFSVQHGCCFGDCFWCNLGLFVAVFGAVWGCFVVVFGMVWVLFCGCFWCSMGAILVATEGLFWWLRRGYLGAVLEAAEGLFWRLQRVCFKVVKGGGMRESE